MFFKTKHFELKYDVDDNKYEMYNDRDATGRKFHGKNIKKQSRLIFE